MKNKLLAALVLIVLVMLATAFRFQASRAQYEYMVTTEPVVLDDKAETNDLNGAGLAGWELVTVERGPKGRTYFFKRRK